MQHGRSWADTPDGDGSDGGDDGDDDDDDVRGPVQPNSCPEGSDLRPICNFQSYK